MRSKMFDLLFWAFLPRAIHGEMLGMSLFLINLTSIAVIEMASNVTYSAAPKEWSA